MKPVRQAGVISTFFAYTGFWDAPEGFEKGHNEVDIEFVWRSAAGRMLMQCNYFTNGRGGHEKYINLGFDPERDLHNYGFKWTRDRIEWYVDGRKVHTAWSDIPKAERSRYKIMMNTWPVQNVAAGWAGFFSWQGYKSAVYDGVRFQRGDSCTIKNWFPA